MTGIVKIKEKILKDADDRVNEILEKAKVQNREILDRASEKAAAKAQEIAQKTAHEANDKKRIIHSIAELEMRKDMLTAKQEMIEKVFDTVLERLNQMDSSRYEQVLFNMLVAAVETGEEELLLSEEGKKKLSPDFMNKLNSSLEVLGKKGKVVLSGETRNIAGGFVLRSEGAEINNSFEAIVKLYRDDIEPKVAEMLF